MLQPRSQCSAVNSPSIHSLGIQRFENQGTFVGIQQTPCSISHSWHYRQNPSSKTQIQPLNILEQYKMPHKTSICSLYICNSPSVLFLSFVINFILTGDVITLSFQLIDTHNCSYSGENKSTHCPICLSIDSICKLEKKILNILRQA